MNSVLVSLIAVTGTLLGSVTTYVFQRRTAAHLEAVGRRERLRQDRLVSCGDFAAAVTEVKRAVITAWFRRNTGDDEWQAAMTEADRMGAVAEGAQIRVLLLFEDDNVRRAADELSSYIAALRAADSLTELQAREAEFARKRLRFISTARRLTSTLDHGDDRPSSQPTVTSR